MGVAAIWAQKGLGPDPLIEFLVGFDQTQLKVRPTVPQPPLKNINSAVKVLIYR